MFSVFWYVNNFSIDGIAGLDDDQITQKNGSISTYTMRIEIDNSLDVDIFNSSLITCLGFNVIGSGSFTLSDYSSPAVLLIQGERDSMDDMYTYTLLM